MTKTMTANIPGARLRDVERELAMLRGEEAINAFLEQHPTEIQILEKMVEQRRSGKPMPSLTRVQRVMLWSDGQLEFKTDPAPEGRARPSERPGSFSGGGGRDRGAQGARPSGGPGSASTAGGGRAPGGPGDSSRPSSGGSGGGRAPGGGFGGQRSSGGAPGGGSRSSGGQGSFGGPGGGGSRPGSRPFGSRPGGPGGSRGGPPGRRDDEGGSRGVPRAGEGWVLLREGEKPPPDREEEPLPLWDEEEQTQIPSSPSPESEAPATNTAGAAQNPAQE